MTRLLRVALIGLLATSCGATAQRLGGRAAEGAIEEAKSEAEEGAPSADGTQAKDASPETGPGTGGSGAEAQAETDGTVQPSPLAGTSFEKMGKQLGEGAAEGAMRRFTEHVGPGGEGPLGESLGAVSSQVTAAALSSAQKELATTLGCGSQPTQQCLEARAESIGEAAAKGMMNRIRWPILIAAFVAGAVCSAGFAQLGRIAARLVERRRAAD